MGYDPLAIVREVRHLLSRRPGRSLGSIAKQLGVDRHTISRNLRRATGGGFDGLQLEYISDALAKLRLGHRLLFRKEIANELGLSSTRALKRWVLRTAQGPQSAKPAPKASQMLPRGRRQ